MTKAPSWDLGQLYVLDSPEIKSDLEKLRNYRRTFVNHQETLAKGPTLAEFAEVIKELEAISRLGSNLLGFADLKFSEDTSDQKVQSLLAAFREEDAELENDLLFFERWWKELPEAKAKEYMAFQPAYAYHLAQVRSYLPHTLPDGEEKVINLKDANGQEALVTLYDSLTNRYQFDVSKITGVEGQKVNREELMVHVRSHKPENRALAYQELYRVFGADGPILGQIYQALVRDWRVENLKLRNYASPISVRHKANDLPAEAVDSLLRVCQAKGPAVFGRYFQEKAKRLNLATFKRYDLYAPLTEDKGHWTFPEAMDLVEKSFGEFDPNLAQLALNVFKSKRLDAAIKPGKASGAFCASLVPGQTPWVLMSFKGKTQDLFTLAHELGHAAHSQLAADLSIFQFHACLPLAETASTFGEMLLASKLLSQVSPTEKEALYFHLLDDAYATVGRQAFFSLFEREAHQMIEAGATVEELSEAYYANLKGQFGPEVDIAPEFRYEWVSIPHFFHSPFYVYAYSFGQLLVYSLWRLYEKEGPPLAKRLMGLLAKGGSGPPLTLIAEAGLGPLNDDFWTGGFEVIEGLLKASSGQ
ncbi:MAG: M3 family oligoendopeptidase [Deltaproteobacteria bacterium]|jgi:oligoendopeptidase F|nr:M3 family oligoendopeptidase [Deltaproteobacteria bacterium]